jgi:uncharacterized protein YegP (UPF0339 family)
MSTDRVEVFRGKGRILPGWFYRVVAANGQTLSVSESYATHWNAKRAARKIAAGVGVKLVDEKPYRRFP